MKASLLGLVLLCAALDAGAAPRPSDEPARWQAQAARVRIVRDEFGIAHVYGQSDADTVFGMIYAQAEDDFSRVERNYIIALGWLAQTQGEAAIFSDLRARLFVDPEHLAKLYPSAPAWLRQLCQAWADGLNFFLLRHPEINPTVIRRFEPWMALSFTEGSIGGDIERVDLARLKDFYGAAASLPPPATTQTQANEQIELSPSGSNGFAIAPSRSAASHALLWINPHTSYYFRSELQMVSEQGLNAYGAVTWGQFFIYQGFNAHNGWMHTSYGGDAVDEYAETIVNRPQGLFYKYGNALRKVQVSTVVVRYKHGGLLSIRSFTVFRTHHGPVVRAENGKWISFKILQDPVPALEQSYLRTKTRDYTSFRATQELRTDTSNNTVYADADGTIAYFHGNFIPKRDRQFDFTHVVDGSDPATEWHGAHALKDTITVKNPESGWIANTNNWPFSVAGASSPKREDYPVYMWTRGENARGLHATEVLQSIRNVTLNSLIAAGYDPHLTGFDVLLPPLITAFDALPADDPRRPTLSAAITALRDWDRRTAADSVPTALAIFWAQEMADQGSRAAQVAELPIYDFLVAHSSDAGRLDALSAALKRLAADFGRWQTPWGEINRFQRLSDDIVGQFDDSKPSLPVGFAPAQWGALASFDSTKPRLTKRIYGSVGNSFVAAVEFGPTVRAKAIMSGGESGDPASPHFTDQAAMFAQGNFRDVYFSKEDVKTHAERSYSP